MSSDDIEIKLKLKILSKWKIKYSTDDININLKLKILLI